MSHFLVAVILPPVNDSTDDIEQLVGNILLPWHEYECTGYTEYLVKLDETEETREDYVKYGEHYGSWEEYVEGEGYILEDGRAFRLTNPNAKWDWWVIGGRYGNRLLTRDEGPCNVAFVEDLDFEGMLEMRRQQYGRTYVEALEYANKHGDVPLELIFGVDPRKTTREEYIASAQAFSAWAVVKDGQWYEKGKMGWWGMSTDDVPEDEWEKQFNDLVTGLPDGTRIAMVDCHI